MHLESAIRNDLIELIAANFRTDRPGGRPDFFRMIRRLDTLLCEELPDSEERLD